jgi:ubiquinone/menaquinone biosynthesis C-methylase UbiE
MSNPVSVTEHFGDQPKAAWVRTMFDRIAPTYDLLNAILSVSLDRGWRRRAVALAQLPKGGTVLDLCGGTGDHALAFRERDRTARIVTSDFSQPMVARAHSKSHRGAKPRLAG